jgi:hypothetical protein
MWLSTVLELRCQHSFLDNHSDCLSWVCFSDSTNFYISDKVTCYDCCIKGSWNPNDIREHEWDSTKWNIWFILTDAKVLRPFFYYERLVPGAWHTRELCSVRGIWWILHPARLSIATFLLMEKNAIFWDVTPCGCCKDRRFGGTYTSIMVERIS